MKLTAEETKKALLWTAADSGARSMKAARRAMRVAIVFCLIGAMFAVEALLSERTLTWVCWFFTGWSCACALAEWQRVHEVRLELLKEREIMLNAAREIDVRGF